MIFWTETMVTEQKWFPALLDRDSYHTCATKVMKRGRPSGGIEFYVAKNLGSKQIFTNGNLIAIAFGKIAVIGVYFKPTLEIDEIIRDLSTALALIPEDHNIVIGGDFNLKPGTPEFDEVVGFLEDRNINLRSDTNTNTYHATQGSSVIDHIFCSQSLESPKCEVHCNGLSDHSAVSLTLKLPRKYSNGRTKIAPSIPKKYYKLDHLSFNTEIFKINSMEPPSSLIKSLDETINRCKTVKSPRPEKGKPWFTSHHYEQRSFMLNKLHIFKISKKSEDRVKYCLARTAYHTSLRLAEKFFELNKVINLLEGDKKQKINAIYKLARNTAAPSNIIPMMQLVDHCKSLFSKFSSQTPSSFSIADDDSNAHSLLSEISVQETLTALTKSKSKSQASSSYTSRDLNQFSLELAPLLTSIFNFSLETGTFPSQWLESVLIFLYKKGSRDDPNNYRTIALENPFLKVFSAILANRIQSYSEVNNLFPDFQFGFRKKYSTAGAATTLVEIVETRLYLKKRTYVGFVDFKKAFDLIDREKLYQKLIKMGFPVRICKLLNFISSNLNMRVKNGETISEPFLSTNGLPQGNSLSPILFNLFIADLPLIFKGFGPNFLQRLIKYLQYADDLAIIADSAEELQKFFDALNNYCKLNNLSINTNKTKVLIFHKGRLPSCKFHIDNNDIQIVNEIVYLGFTFTPQVSFTKHAMKINAKARSRLGFLASKIPFKILPKDILLQVFQVYIYPIFYYGLSLWFNKCARSAIEAINATFSKFLKIYLGIPYWTPNAPMHLITNTQPLEKTLKFDISSHIATLSFPTPLEGYQLKIARDTNNILEHYNPIPIINSVFWRSRILHRIPENPINRKKICREIFDSDHMEKCTTLSFHPKASESCICIFCGTHLEAYHSCDL